MQCVQICPHAHKHISQVTCTWTCTSWMCVHLFLQTSSDTGSAERLPIPWKRKGRFTSFAPVLTHPRTADAHWRWGAASKSINCLVFRFWAIFLLLVSDKWTEYTLRCLFYFAFASVDFQPDSPNVDSLTRHAALKLCHLMVKLSLLQSCPIQTWSFPLYRHLSKNPGFL